MKSEKLTASIIRIMEGLTDILTSIISRNQGVRLDLQFGLPQNKAGKEKKQMKEVTITTEQKIKATIAPVTSSGKPAKLDGKPAWSVNVGDAEVEESEDGLSADLISSDTPGFTEIVVKADANLGEGVEEISTVILLTVEGAKAANLGVTLGQPEPKQ